MRLHPNPLVTLFALWFSIWAVVLFLVLYPLMFVFLEREKTYRQAHLVRKIWLDSLLRIGFMRVETQIAPGFDSKAVYVITPNHTSRLDIICLVARLPLFFSFLAMDEFKKVPLYGKWFRTLDLGVNRKNPIQAAKSYLQSKKVIESGRSLVMFPEATISKIVPQLSAFKDGPFRLAIEMQVPVLPISFIDNYKLLPDQGVFEIRPGKVYQIVHQPIETKGMSLKDVEKLKQQVFATIQNKLIEFESIANTSNA
ncbi:MAG: lysophospholipid acyltransferase family protein [Bacteroidia bacterium]